MPTTLIESAIPLALTIFADDRPWAITPGAVRSLLGAAHHPDFDALAARFGREIDNAPGPVENHNGTAVMEVRGPLFRYRSIFTWLLGGTAVETMALDLHAALDDPAVKSIVLSINSPGGQVDGINEMANMIRAANAVKPVTAYVGALAGSAAYWLASAAGKIVADETAQLGSIGVLATILDDRAADEKQGVKRFDIISTQSPLKRADPGTDEGRAQLQQLVDGIAQTFIEQVAGFRGVSSTIVQTDFGRGAMLGARAAVAVGMADEIGSLEGLIARGGAGPMMPQMRDNPGLRVAAPPIAVAQAEGGGFDQQQLEQDTENQELNSDRTCTCPPGTETCNCGAADDDEDGDEDGDEAEGTEQLPDDSSIPQGGIVPVTPTEDRQRIAAILTCEEARGRDELARTLALETDLTLEAAQRILKAAPVAVAAVAVAASALDVRMGQIPNPRVGLQADPQQDQSVGAEVQRVLAFIPKDRLRLHAQAQRTQ